MIFNYCIYIKAVSTGLLTLISVGFHTFARISLSPPAGDHPSEFAYSL